MRNSRLNGNHRLLFGLAAAVWILQAQPLTAVTLQSHTVRDWTTYVEATERRIAQELESGSGFLVLDFQSFAGADQELRTIAAGGIPVAPMATFDSWGRGIAVDGGAIHHWRGCVMVPGVDLGEVLSRIANPGPLDERQEDVLDSAVLGRGPDWLKIYLKLQRSKIVTVVYNTEHLVSYRRHNRARASSRSEALKIAELEFPNSGREKEKPQGSDHGFLWRLNSYWRYRQVDGGVLIECESVSLSRSVPAVLEFLIRPIINRMARQSMQRTLAGLRDRLIRSSRQPTDALARGVQGLQSVNCNPLLIIDLLRLSQLQFPHYTPLFERETVGPSGMLADRPSDRSWSPATIPSVLTRDRACERVKTLSALNPCAHFPPRYTPPLPWPPGRDAD